MKRIMVMGRNVIEGRKKPLFYHFNQNSSGGVHSFDHTAGISVNVIIEAYSADEANRIAQDIGLYFDGEGYCSCHGDRWYEASAADSAEYPHIHGAPLTDSLEHPLDTRWASKGEPEAYVHYLNGMIEGWA